MDQVEALTLIRLMVMDRPLCEVMPRTPQMLLDEIIASDHVAITFGMYYQKTDDDIPTPVDDLEAWRQNVQRVANLEQLRRRGWGIKAWPHDFADNAFWDDVRVSQTLQTIELKAA